jgi:hypothetical protein
MTRRVWSGPKPEPLMVRVWFTAESGIGFGLNEAITGGGGGAITFRVAALDATPLGFVTATLQEGTEKRRAEKQDNDKNRRARMNGRGHSDENILVRQSGARTGWDFGSSEVYGAYSDSRGVTGSRNFQQRMPIR